MNKDPKKKQDSYKNQFEDFRKIWRQIYRYRIAIISGCCLMVGLILSFFYLRLGSAFVGLGFGLSFFQEIHGYFIQLRDVYIAHGVFKTVMLIGTIVFLLISIPIFILSAGFGYGVMNIANRIARK
ncbi:MAG: hypothetical protein R3E91_03635 [Chlamydiales bacterium]